MNYRGESIKEIEEIKLRELGGYKKDEIINKIYEDVLAKNKIAAETIEANGIEITARFALDKLSEKCKEIVEIIDQLPKEINQGIDFYELCLDNAGNKWCDEETADKLLVLGIAIGELKLPIPREFWPRLENKMPVVQRIQDVVETCKF